METQKAAEYYASCTPGTLLHLQSTMLLALAIQRVGPQEDSPLPSVSELLTKACQEHQEMSLHVLTPSDQPIAFSADAVNYRYNKVARATSLALRAMLMFHALGTKEIFELMQDIKSAESGDRKFLSQEASAFQEFLEAVGEFMNDPTSAGILQAFRTARRMMAPEHHILVDTLELAYQRMNSGDDNDFPKTALASAQKLAAKCYQLDDDSRAYKASTFFYFHSLALATATYIDLQKSNMDSKMKADAASSLSTLAGVANGVPKKLKSGWDRKVISLATIGSDDPLYSGEVAWTGAVDEGYLGTLSSA